MSDQNLKEIVQWIQLIRSPQIGPKRFWGLLNQFGRIDQAILNLKEAFPYEKAEKEREHHDKKNLSVLPALDVSFPNLLKTLADCPPILSVAGNINVFKKPSIAIVGARNASIVGKKIATQLAHDLSQAGWCIVSGMARGIDASAHQGALPNASIAVLAGGVDVIYPEEHRKLYEDLIKHGAVISEMPLGTSPTPSLFPRRNRIISGISRLTIVIEAAYNSGSMITAQCALEQGRDVCAVPGSPLDPRNKGCHILIKQGAPLVETVDDVLSVLGDVPKIEEGVAQTMNSSIHTAASPYDLKDRLLADLSHTPLLIDDIMNQYDYPAPVILGLISELELENKLSRIDGHFLLKTI